MYTLGSAEFNQIIETPNNKAIKSRLVLLDDNTIIDKIKSLILYSASCSQELQIGTTNMAYIDAEVESNLILTNREARLECGVELSDGTVEYIPMGVFTIQKPQGDIDFVKFTANDRMQKFDYPYSSTLTYPTTDKAMLEELATMCGVTLATNIDNPITIDKALDGYTRREVLGYIAGLHGKFACFNRNGELELKWYNTDTPITKNIGLIWGFEKSDEDFTVSKIEVAKNNETTLTSGNGYGVVQHSNPLATQEIVNDLFTSLNGFTYNASVVDILDDIRLDLGDVIKVTYLDGKDYLVPCMSIKQDFGQGSTNIESFAKSDTENTYRFTGPTIQYLNRMAMELLVANRVIATKVDAEYVNSHAITTDNLDAITANITNLVVDKIDGKYADIHLANIDIADIGLFFANSGLLKDVTIVEGHITGELDAVRINADVITTGTLSVDRLLVTGKDSIVYQINVDSSGLSETELEKEVYQKYLNGTDIVANSITATQLNVSQIFADKTVTSTLFAQDITATGTITGAKLIGADAEISSGSIGGFDIKNNFLGFKEESEYLDINTNEDKMSYWYSFKIQPHSYNDVSASSTKVFWIGANPIINGDGVGEDSFYDETKLFYPLYITADGTINSEGKDTSIIFGSGHNYGLNTVNWAWSDDSSIVFGQESIEVKAGKITLNKLLDFTGKGFKYDGTELLAFNDSGIYSPKVSTEKLSAKESVSTDELYAYSSTIGYGGMLSNGKVTVFGDIETKTTSPGTTANIYCDGDIFLPVSASQNTNIGTTFFSVPASGGWQDNVSYLFQDMANSKTFLGSYLGAVDPAGYENYWHNVISVRHRNGSSDGSAYGMYIRSHLTQAGSLVWNKQHGGEWEGEKAILDTENYTGLVHQLSYFLSTSNQTVAPGTTINAIGYTGWGNISLFGQMDGAIYKQAYDTLWQHEMFGDYRTGKIAVRGKNNGNWTDWRSILDKREYSSSTSSLSVSLTRGYSYLLIATNSNAMSYAAIITYSHWTGGFAYHKIAESGSASISFSGTTCTVSFSADVSSTTIAHLVEI